MREGVSINSTRGVGPFFGRIIFSTRGVKIFQVRESNSEILRGGVTKLQLGEWDLFAKKNFSTRGVRQDFSKSENSTRGV